MAEATPHESAVQHVTGRARYTDDLPPLPGQLVARLVTSPVATGHLRGLDLSRARLVPGVVAVLTAADVPGRNRTGPIVHDEPLLCDGPISFLGQAVALVLARDAEAARQGAAAVAVQVDPGPAPLTHLRQALEAGSFHTEPHHIARGDLEAGRAAATLVLRGEVETPAQDHFYLETHAARAVREDDDTVSVVSSTQHPSEVQAEVAAVLGLSRSQVVCEVPRLGGGFGGKESQASPIAALAALGAWVTGAPVALRLDRGQDMSLTGKRHPFLARYEAAFSADGALLAYQVKLWSDGGWSLDLSGPVLDRALFHLDAGLYLPNLAFEGRVCKTNLPSNTAFRGFGGPQGALVTHTVLDRAARALGLPLEALWARNAYRPGHGLTTPYGQGVPEPRGFRMLATLREQADLASRRRDLAIFNQASPWIKRGLGVGLVQFGISFTNSLLNQAGALVHVYADGSVQVNHGGTEMGQGLHTKVRGVVADVFGLPLDKVRVTATRTDKVPNTSATAASSGSDLNGAAAQAAALTLRERLSEVACRHLSASTVRFEGGVVKSPEGRALTFAALAQQAWAERVSLSSTGYYATPNITYDRSAGRGTPFFYFAYGVAALEVEVHGLTGEHRLVRVDVLHDCGQSLNPTIDTGQVEGALVQGLGWLSGEEVQVDAKGRTLTRGPSTYKIPSAGDVPTDWRIQLLPDAAQAGVVGGSKAVGEPPFLLALALPAALREAIAAFGPGEPQLSLPATPEAVLRAITLQRGERWA